MAQKLFEEAEAKRLAEMAAADTAATADAVKIEEEKLAAEKVAQDEKDANDA